MPDLEEKKDPPKLSDRELRLAWIARAKGVSIRDIAKAYGVAKSTLYKQLKILPLPQNPEYCEIVWPEGGQLTPGSEPRLILDGDRAYDSVSHQTGIENHPLLQRDPRTDPAPEPKKSYKKGKLKGGRG